MAKKPWIRFYSIEKGLSQRFPWIASRKLSRPWRVKAQKELSKDPVTRCPALKLQRMVQMSKVTNQPTIFPMHAATCPALTGVMDSGFVMTAAYDFVISMENGEMFFMSKGERIHLHSPEQTDGMREYISAKPIHPVVIKLQQPWRVHAHKDVCFLQLPVTYHKEERFSVATGIADPTYSYEINLQLFWHMLEDGQYLIEAGTPLAQWIPIHRDYLNPSNFNVEIEDANDDDHVAEDYWQYHMRNTFAELQPLQVRKKIHQFIVSLNKNSKRFE